jgi:hypothetical protein
MDRSHILIAPLAKAKQGTNKACSSSATAMALLEQAARRREHTDTDSL